MTAVMIMALFRTDFTTRLSSTSRVHTVLCPRVPPAEAGTKPDRP